MANKISGRCNISGQHRGDGTGHRLKARSACHPFASTGKEYAILIAVLFSMLHTGLCNYQECVNLPTEEAARGAEIVISGTARKVTPDRERSTIHAPIQKAVVEVKRVFKGDTLLDPVAAKPSSSFWHRSITVGGLGNPNICRNTILEKETKILMLHANGKGEFFLNSSVLPLTLLNLDYVEAIVQSEYII